MCHSHHEAVFVESGDVRAFLRRLARIPRNAAWIRVAMPSSVSARIAALRGDGAAEALAGGVSSDGTRVGAKSGRPGVHRPSNPSKESSAESSEESSSESDPRADPRGSASLDPRAPKKAAPKVSVGELDRRVSRRAPIFRVQSPPRASPVSPASPASDCERTSPPPQNATVAPETSARSSSEKPPLSANCGGVGGALPFSEYAEYAEYAEAGDVRERPMNAAAALGAGLGKSYSAETSSIRSSSSPVKTPSVKSPSESRAPRPSRPEPSPSSFFSSRER